MPGQLTDFRWMLHVAFSFFTPLIVAALVIELSSDDHTTVAPNPDTHLTCVLEDGTVLLDEPVDRWRDRYLSHGRLELKYWVHGHKFNVVIPQREDLSYCVARPVVTVSSR